MIQINLIEQYDRSKAGDFELLPYERHEDGTYDFASPNESYFDRVEFLMAEMQKRGLTPALVLLWLNYVPGTAANDNFPGDIMPARVRQNYLKMAVERYDKYSPIYVISGDTTFSDESCQVYLEAARQVREAAPNAILTYHFNPVEDAPVDFNDSQLFDFCLFQSGHNPKDGTAWHWAAKYADGQQNILGVNGEPCYEGMTHCMKYPRFSRDDVRRAGWWSVLSGASAGLTYGAHGVWSWHTQQAEFASRRYWGTPFNWDTALRFEGADDYAFIKELFERYQLYPLQACTDAQFESNEIRLAATPDQQTFMAYLPYSTEVTLPISSNDYTFQRINLKTRQTYPLQGTAKGRKTTFPMSDFNGDSLIVAKIKRVRD